MATKPFTKEEREALDLFVARFGAEGLPRHFDARKALGGMMTTNLLRRRALAYGPYVKLCATIRLTPRGKAARSADHGEPR